MTSASNARLIEFYNSLPWEEIIKDPDIRAVYWADIHRIQLNGARQVRALHINGDEE
jgi:hypothetical protein